MPPLHYDQSTWLAFGLGVNSDEMFPARQFHELEIIYCGRNVEVEFTHLHTGSMLM